VASAFFVIAYLGISLPVVGVGLLTDVAGLRAAGLIFAAVVATLAAAVAFLRTEQQRRWHHGRTPRIPKPTYQ
jgi:hypothetical protein